MPAWSFQPRFRLALANGLAEARREPPPYPGVRPKRQTIRALRRDGRDPRPGDAVRIWIAQRTPDREFLGTTPPLVKRLTIEVPHDGSVIVDLRWQTRAGITRLAHLDSLADWAELICFLEETHGLPFAGFVYRW